MRAILTIALTTLGGAAAAVPLPPGGTIAPEDFDAFVAAAVAPGDPAFFGEPGPSGAGAGRAQADGFDGFEVVENLSDATGQINSSVTLSEPGRTVFAYEFGGFLSGAGTESLAFATVSGFAGLEVAAVPVGVDEDSFFAPPISRSADGDVVTFDFTFGGADPQGLFVDRDGDPSEGLIEPILLITDAPAVRTDGGGTVGLFLDFSFGLQEVPVEARLVAPAPIPLPAGAPLLAAGLGALILLRRRA